MLTHEEEEHGQQNQEEEPGKEQVYVSVSP